MLVEDFQIIKLMNETDRDRRYRERHGGWEEESSTCDSLNYYGSESAALQEIYNNIYEKNQEYSWNGW